MHERTEPQVPEAEDPNMGEIVPDDAPESFVGRAVRVVKDAVIGAPRAPRLVMNSLHSVGEVDLDKLPDYERNMYLPAFKNLKLALYLKREAAAKMRQAQSQLAAARARLEMLQKLADQDGIGAEWRMIDAPAPDAGPPPVNKVRVRALRPLHRVYAMPAPSAAWALWFKVNNGKDYAPEPRSFQLVGKGHVTDVPDFLVDDLVKAGAVERVPADTPRQLPDGRPIQ